MLEIKSNFCLYSTIYLLLNTVESARILAVFPTPTVSHQAVFRPLTQELARRRHEVTVITPYPAFPEGQSPNDLIEIDIKNVSVVKWDDNFHLNYGKKIHYPLMKTVLEATLNRLSVNQFTSDAVQEALKKNFDVIIMESHYKTAFGMSHTLKIPMILISSYYAVGSYEIVGAPVHPLYYPFVLARNINQRSFYEQMMNMFHDLTLRYALYENEEKENQLIEIIDGNSPKLEDLYNNAAMLMINVHPIWEGNRPAPISVVHLGALHMRPKQPLPKDLKSYLDYSVNGVIYVSFGTNVNPSQLPKEKIDILMKVLSKIPYDVIWKWDIEELPGKPKNIKIGKWFPQSDLLRHPKIKLFITQAGLQSTDEAITAGVPLIGIPMLFDQWCNAEKYVHHKIGMKIELESLTEEELADGIHNVIENESYRSNVARLRSLMYDQPQRPLERAVWWTEHVLRHGGGTHLRSPAANMSWTERLELELVAIFLFVFLIFIAIILHALRSLVIYVTNIIELVIR